ncbi:MAG: putative maltokinase, partial [Candidatus Omnitrophota bacterium]
VDGLRLDAVPYLYEQEGTNCENLPETHAFLRELRNHVNRNFKNRMLLGEANQWPEDASAYFAKGDECHMAFHFPLMPRLFMASRLEDRYPVVEILQQTPPIPESCQWATFLRNHDELTLEMVTDKERDYMYRVYGSDPQMRINLGIRRRLAPILGNNRRKIELMNGLLFSMLGTPVLYYGDELGMGDNIYLGDRDGVRTPMQWSADRNAGFSRSNPQKLYLPIIIDPEYHYEAINVEAQQNNLSSLLWWTRRLIALRRRYQAFGRGTIEFLHPENRKVFVFTRHYQEETILVVANLSRFTQYAELNLSAFKGMTPVELFGQAHFPPIGELPYFIILGPHTFYWFSLEKQRMDQAIQAVVSSGAPTLEVPGEWASIFQPEGETLLEGLLPSYLQRCRWFGGKARPIRSAELMDIIPISISSVIIFVHLNYREGEPEVYTMPLCFETGERVKTICEWFPHATVAMIKSDNGEGVLYDAMYDPAFCQLLLQAITKKRQFKGRTGKLLAYPLQALQKIPDLGVQVLETKVLTAEQTNSSVVYGNLAILKLFRRLEEGVDPDVEIGKFLTERVAFPHIPSLIGFLVFQKTRRGSPATVAALQNFVVNEGDAWEYTLEALEHYFEDVIAHRKNLSASAVSESGISHKKLLAVATEEVSSFAIEQIGSYLESAKVLGTRTAELHLALASEKEDPNFSPEPLTSFYQRSLYQSMRSLMLQTFQLLRKRLPRLPEDLRKKGEHLLGLEKEILKRFQALISLKSSALRIRCHGDYHLGQVLYTGKDFVIIDFEGEPARSLSERRLKSLPLRDVAGMIRSFHYAASTALYAQAESQKNTSGILGPGEISFLEPWARFWYVWVSATFLKAYFETAKEAPFLPKKPEELEVLLHAYLLEKAIYELAYELNNRPEWVKIPLEGILHLVESTG